MQIKSNSNIVTQQPSFQQLRVVPENIGILASDLANSSRLNNFVSYCEKAGKDVYIEVDTKATNWDLKELHVHIMDKWEKNFGNASKKYFSIAEGATIEQLSNSFKIFNNYEALFEAFRQPTPPIKPDLHYWG